MFELLHPFKGTTIKLHIVISSGTQYQEMTMFLVLSAFTSSPISLPATIKASVSLYIP